MNVSTFFESMLLLCFTKAIFLETFSSVLVNWNVIGSSLSVRALVFFSSIACFNCFTINSWACRTVSPNCLLTMFFKSLSALINCCCKLRVRTAFPALALATDLLVAVFPAVLVIVFIVILFLIIKLSSL